MVRPGPERPLSMTQRPFQLTGLPLHNSRAQAQSFEHAPDALLERHAAGDELGADVRHVAGDADPEDEAGPR